MLTCTLFSQARLHRLSTDLVLEPAHIYLLLVHRLIRTHRTQTWSWSLLTYIFSLFTDSSGHTEHKPGLCAYSHVSSPCPQTQLDMLSTDLVSELRAEVTRWWEMLQKQQQQQRQQMPDPPHSQHGHGLLSPILGAMLGDGPIRMITLGQELTVDLDEKTLGEMPIKDMQVRWS